jgi:hypothetical protein
VSDKDYFGGWTVDDSDVRAWWRKQGFSLFCVICLVLLVTLGFCSQTKAAPLSHPTQLKELFLSAVVFGGYAEKCQARRGGCPMPAVVLAGIEDDNTVGQFDPRHPTFVKITSQIMPGSLAFNAVVVHEFTHYLQWLFGDLGPETLCKDHPPIEEQAYKAAAAYLAQFGINYDYSDQLFNVVVMAAMCEAGEM